jgi:hypothetical protein
MIVRLQDNPNIIVRPDYSPVTVTGYTATQVTGSGSATVTQSGTNPIVYDVFVPSGGTVQWTDIAGKPDLWTTGETQTAINTATTDMWTSGETIGYVNAQGFITDISGKLDKTIYQTYTGTTAPNQFAAKIHYHSQYLTGVTASQITGVTSSLYAPTIHTHTIANVTGLQTALNDKVSQASIATYTGTTAPAQFASKSSITTYTGTTAPNAYAAKNHLHTGTYSPTGHTHVYSTLTGLPTLFTGDTYVASGITQITKLGNQVTIYVPADSITGVTWGMITGKPNLTLESDFTGHTSNTSIHYAQSGISITYSQISDPPFIPTDLNQLNDTSNLLFNRQYSGLTGAPDLTVYATVSNLSTYTGTTAPATFTSKSSINTYTGTTAPAAFASKSSIATYTGTTAPAQFAPFTPSIVSVTGTTSINATHANKIVECDGTFTVTLPNSMVTGMRVDIINIGTGTITLAASTTLVSDGTKLDTRYTGASAYHRGSNVWLAVGRLTT